MTLHPWTIWRYLARQFTGWFFSISAILAGIISIFEIVELFRRATSKPHITFPLIIKMGFLKLPASLEQLLPLIIFFSCFLCLRSLNQKLELVAIRVSGLSMIQIIVPFLSVVALFSIAYWVVINPLSSSLFARFESIEKKLFNPQQNSLSIVDSGLWFIKNGPEGAIVIHSKGAEKIANQLNDLTLYYFDKDFLFQKRFDAQKASLSSHDITLYTPWVTGPLGWAKKEKDQSIPIVFSLAALEENVASPKTISFGALPHFIDSMEDMGFSATLHRVHWYKLLGAPIMFLAMVLWAAFFSLRWSRDQKAAKTIAVACCTIFTLYIINELTRSLGLSGVLSPSIAVSLSVGLIFFSGCALVLHLQEKQ